MKSTDSSCTPRQSCGSLLPGYGLWIRYDSGVWRHLHSLSAVALAVGNIDGSTDRKADIVVSFAGHGTYRYLNDLTWVSLHALTAQAQMGDLDGGGRADVVMNFTGYGEWVFYNNASWSLLHGTDTTTFTIGNVDGDTNGRADVIVSFPWLGSWQFRNNSQWSQVHYISASETTTSGLDVILVSLPGFGLWAFRNGTTWTQIHASGVEAVVEAELNSQ